SLSFFTHTSTPALYTLSLHDALPISARVGPQSDAAGHRPHPGAAAGCLAGLARDRRPDRHHLCRLCRLRLRSAVRAGANRTAERSEEHTSELQSRFDLVCRLLLEKKK